MTKKFKKVKIALMFLLLIMITPICTLVKASTTLNTFNYSLGGLGRKTSPTFNYNSGNFKYTNYWSSVVLDAEQGYYFEINMKKVTLGIPHSVANYKYHPGVFKQGNTVVADFGNSLEEGKYRYDIYNYGALSTAGTLKSISY